MEATTDVVIGALAVDVASQGKYQRPQMQDNCAKASHLLQKFHLFLHLEKV